MTAEDGLPLPRRRWAFLAVVLAIGMAVMDSTRANVALPVIATELHTSPALAIWIVNAYQLALVISLLPLAAIGDSRGYKRVYLAGLALFTAASLACAMADSLLWLTLARVVQGFGAAGIMSVNTALLRNIFPRARLGHAIGVNSMVVALGSTIGPSLSSAILAVASWHWIFLVNVPLGLLALVVGARALPDTEGSSRRFDVVAALLTACSVGLIITAIDSLGHRLAWHLVALQALLAVAATVLLVRRQLRVTAPLLPVDLLRNRLFSLSIGSAVCCFVAQMLAYVALPFHLHNDLGFPLSTVGFLMTPWPLAVGLVAPIAGGLSDRFPPGWIGGTGLLIMSGGLLLLAGLPEAAGMADIAWRMAMCGFGFALFQSPNNRTVITSAPRARSGAASGMVATARLFGQATGSALVALFLARLPEGGASLSLYVASGFAGLAATVSLLRGGRMAVEAEKDGP